MASCTSVSSGVTRNSTAAPGVASSTDVRSGSTRCARPRIGTRITRSAVDHTGADLHALLDGGPRVDPHRGFAVHVVVVTADPEPIGRGHVRAFGGVDGEPDDDPVAVVPWGLR